MSIDAKAEELIEPLRGAFAATIQTALGTLPPHDALRLANSLCTVWLETLRGMRVTHRERPPLDPAAIARDWMAGLKYDEIMRKHGIARGTAYRYHPSRTSDSEAA